MPKNSQLEKEDPNEEPPAPTEVSPAPPPKVKKPRTEKQIAATKALVERSRLKREEAKSNKAKVDAMEKIDKGEVKEEPQQVLINTEKPKKVYKKVKKVKKEKPPPPPPSESESESSDQSSDAEYEQPPLKNVVPVLENPLSKPRQPKRTIRNTPPKPVSKFLPEYVMPRKYRYPN